MKFKKDGKVFEDIYAAMSHFCKNTSCGECPVQGATYHPCIRYIDRHPAEAARLMGYEVVEEKSCDTCANNNLPIDATGNPCWNCKGEDMPEYEPKEANIDKQKPRICEVLGVEVGERFYFMGHESILLHVNENGVLLTEDGTGAFIPPWIYRMIEEPNRIIRKPRFTEQEAEDARAIMRLFSRDLWTTIKRCVDDTLWVQGNGGAFMNINNERFKSLLPGDSVKLSEIVGGDL